MAYLNKFRIKPIQLDNNINQNDTCTVDTSDALTPDDSVDCTKNENYRSSATFAFDFKAVKVFSIERLANNDSERTVIGCLLPEPVNLDGIITIKNKVLEWTLYCNEVQHEMLVDEFKKTLT